MVISAKTRFTREQITMDSLLDTKLEVVPNFFTCVNTINQSIGYNGILILQLIAWTLNSTLLLLNSPTCRESQLRSASNNYNDNEDDEVNRKNL